MFAHLGIRALFLVLLAMILVDQGANAEDPVTFEQFKASLTDYMHKNAAKDGEKCVAEDDQKYKNLDTWRQEKEATPVDPGDPELTAKNTELTALKGKVCPLTKCDAGTSTCGAVSTSPSGNAGTNSTGLIDSDCLKKAERNVDVGADCREKAEASFPASGPILTLSSLCFGITVGIAFFSARSL